jgi:dCMP deaminase
MDGQTGELVGGTSSCSMCQRLIINAGISTVVVRDTKTEYRVIDVDKEWIENDSSLSYHEGY